MAVLSGGGGGESSETERGFGVADPRAISISPLLARVPVLRSFFNIRPNGVFFELDDFAGARGPVGMAERELESRRLADDKDK